MIDYDKIIDNIYELTSYKIEEIIEDMEYYIIIQYKVNNSLT